MSIEDAGRQVNRRTFLEKVGLVGAAGIVGLPARRAAAEPPPEITALKLIQTSGVCIAPQYVAEALLHREGFTNVEYVKKGRVQANEALASGEVQLTMGFVGNSIIQIDSGDPNVVLSGMHVGCYELFAADSIRVVHDLRGKRVAVTELGSGRHVFVSSLLAYVGLDPHKDVQFVTSPAAESTQLFADGKIDAYQAWAEEVQELRAKNVGHVIANSATDRPWSQYFCCTVAANRDFARKHPNATKRALRALLKAANVCALEPDRVARFLVDKGYALRHDHALRTLKDIPYLSWREYDPEDTVRFYALRLHEVGMIKSTPKNIIARGTDWRFLSTLKKELKE